VYVDWLGTLGPFDVTFAIQFSLYISFIFLMLGMSNIRLRAFIVPFVCIAMLSYLVGSFETMYLFPRVAGFDTGLIYAGYQSILDVNTSFPLQCLLMYFIGTVLRARIAQRQALPLSTLLFLSLLTVLVYASAGLSVTYDIRTEAGTWFHPALEFGTAWGGAALLFVAGCSGGGRGALLAVAAWCVVNIGIPVAIRVWLGVWVGQEWVFVPGVGLVDDGEADRSSWGAFNISTSIGASLVGTYVGIAPGWTPGPLDLLFAVFGWRVHRALLRRQEAHLREEAAFARADVPQFGIPIDLPSLRVRYADRLLIWPTGLLVLYGAIGVLVALTTLVAAPW
jgi:hypothetical protein